MGKTFINELEEFKSRMFTDRVFMYLKLKGGYLLSVQGSGSHHSTPKETIEPKGYKKMEVSIYNKDVDFTKVGDVFKDKELLTEFEGKEVKNGVYGNIPVKTINDIYKKYRER